MDRDEAFRCSKADRMGSVGGIDGGRCKPRVMIPRIGLRAVARDGVGWRDVAAFTILDDEG
jgi:hypothetical protein